MPVSAASATPGGKCAYSRRDVKVAIAAINTIAPSANPQMRVSGRTMSAALSISSAAVMKFHHAG